MAMKKLIRNSDKSTTIIFASLQEEMSIYECNYQEHNNCKCRAKYDVIFFCPYDFVHILFLLSNISFNSFFEYFSNLLSKAFLIVCLCSPMIFSMSSLLFIFPSFECSPFCIPSAVGLPVPRYHNVSQHRTLKYLP